MDKQRMKQSVAVIRVVSILAVAVAFGCVEAPSPICPTCGPGVALDSGVADGGDGVDAGLPPCTGDTDCDEGQVCREGECLDCFSDGDCEGGQICVGNRCVQGCRSNFPAGCDAPEDCPDANCSPARPICTERGPNGGTCRQCSTDAHCIDYGFGNTCVDNECTSTCGPNRPCAEGVCDEGSGRCVECLEDAQCGASGLICVSESCVQGCRSDEGCAVGQICTDDACVPGCRNDQGCEDGELCVDGLCARGDCRDNGDCGPGQRCVNNFCGSPCGQDSDCGVGSICVENNCQPGCRGDDDVVTCGEGAFCRDQQCIRGCPDDDACPGGQICLENSCREGCREDGQCEDGLRCIENTCLRGCRDDSNCFAGQRCIENECRQSCTQDASCGNGRICEEGLCQDGCRDDAGCGYNARCENNQCVAGCRDNNSCDRGETCFENNCAPGCFANGSGCPAGYVCNRQARACVQCLSDNDCGGPLTCDRDSYTCVLRCQRSSDCPGGAICSGNHCVPCRDDNQCSNGLVCDTNSGCVECTTNDHCDRGEVCDPIRKRCTAPGLNGVCQPDASEGGCTTNGNRDCQDGLRCYRVNNGRDINSTYCLQPCANNSECPRGFHCLEQGACFPFSSRQELTCEAYAELGTRCTNSQQCGVNSVADDAICSGYGRYSNPPRCSWFCASNTDCPSNHVCEDPPPANGNDPAPRCTPQP